MSFEKFITFSVWLEIVNAFGQHIELGYSVFNAMAVQMNSFSMVKSEWIFKRHTFDESREYVQVNSFCKFQRFENRMHHWRLIFKISTSQNSLFIDGTSNSIIPHKNKFSSRWIRSTQLISVLNILNWCYFNWPYLMSKLLIFSFHMKIPMNYYEQYIWMITERKPWEFWDWIADKMPNVDCLSIRKFITNTSSSLCVSDECSKKRKH